MIVTGPGGRRLAVSEWGDPEGAVVFYLHGAPGSRLLRHDGDGYAAAGLRVVTYDRPGYGGSDPAPGRAVADTAADVAAIADHLRVGELGVAGISCGGLHAFAVAALLPDRVARCVGIKALAPYDAVGLDFFAGMEPEQAEALQAMATGGRDALEADAAEAQAWVESGCPGITTPEPVGTMLREAFTEAFRQGTTGYVDDWAAHFQPLGFDLDDVAAPTRLLAAREDRQVPPGHVHWFAERLPDASLTWFDGGHLDPHDAEELAALAWAARGDEASAP